MRRSLKLLPITLQNIEIFTAAAAHEFGSQRDGDQYGTLLAGAWSVMKEGIATPEQAKAIIRKYDWSEYVEHKERDDSAQALSAVLAAQIRLLHVENLSVHELIINALDRASNLEQQKAIKMTLRRHGVVIEHGVADYRDTHLFMAFCTADRLRSVMGSAFVPDFKGQLGRIKGGVRPKNPVSIPGGNARGVLIPLTMILTDVGIDPETTAESQIEGSPF